MNRYKFVLVLIVLLIGSGYYLKNRVQKVATQRNTYEMPRRPAYADDREWHRLKMRGGVQNTGAIIKGRSIADSLFRHSQKGKKYKDAGIRSWSSRGPGNIPGRVRAMVYKRAPDKLIIGAAGGGLWKLESGSSVWAPINDFLPSLAVTSIAMSNVFSNTIYASTGEGFASETIGLPGAGIFKSTDGGETWTQLASTANSEFYWVNKIAVNPTDENHILAVTSQADKDGNPSGGKLKQSLNGGATWTDILNTPGFLTDVEFHPADDDIRIVSGMGELWYYNGVTGSYEDKSSQINNYPGRVEIALAPSNSNYVYLQVNSEEEGSEARRYRSINSGDTWTYLGVSGDVFGVNLGNYANTVWVDPADHTQVYFGGLDLYRSVDSGSSISRISVWTAYHTDGDDGNTPQLHGDQHIMLASPYFNATTNPYVYIGNDGGVMASTDIRSANQAVIGGGSTYVNLSNNSLITTQFYSASASPHTGMIGGGTQDNSFITRNSNGTWFQHNTGDGSMLLFHPTDPDIIYANTNYNNLRKSTDGGMTYTSVADLGESESELIAPIAINPNDPDLVYLGGNILKVYDDSNGSLSQIHNGKGGDVYITEIAVSQDGNEIWLGWDTGDVEYSVNGGANWFVFYPIVDGPVTDIAINDSLYQTGGIREIIVTSGGYTQTNITKITYDPSLTFPTFPFLKDTIALPFEMQVNTVTYHPTNKNWIYVGTDVGIFASEDKGETWSVTPIYTSADAIFNNEGPVYTEVSELFWDYESFGGAWQLQAATFGRGVWSSGYILDTVYVNQDYGGPFYWGTMSRPYRNFLEGLAHAENTGATVKVVSDGTHDQISTTLNADKRVLIKGGAASSIIE